MKSISNSTRGIIYIIISAFCFALMAVFVYNILGNKSKKENAIDKLLELHEYDNVYVIGNEINDYNMIKKYNGYLISNKKNTSLNTIKNFLELKKKL